MHQKIAALFKFPSVLLLIIFCGVILRVYRLRELFHFTFDEEVFAFVGKRMFVNHHIPLIGGVTPFHVHVAPYFYWISGVFLYLSKLNPIGWGVVAAIFSGIVMLVLYQTGKELFNKYVGILAVFLYSFSFYQNVFDRHYWGLIVDGLVSLLSIYSLHKIIKGNQQYLYLLAVTLVFGMHADLTALALFVLTGIAFLYFRPVVSKKVLAKALLIFLVSFLPLVIFDLRHNFVNSRGFLQYFDELKTVQKKSVTTTPLDSFLFLPRITARLMYPFGDHDLAKLYSYCSQHVYSRVMATPILVAFVVVFLFTILVLYTFKEKQKNLYGLKLILFAFFSTYLGVIFYGSFLKGDLFDHYLAPLFPLFFLVIAFFLFHIGKKSKIILLVFLAIFVITNSQYVVTAQHRFGYQDKVSAVQWAIQETRDQPFELDVISSCFAYNGYRYLFYLYGKEPDKSYVDVNFTHLFDKPPAEKHPSYLVVITNPDFEETGKYYQEYNRYKEKLIKRAQFGMIEVLLVDNSNLDFIGKF